MKIIRWILGKIILILDFITRPKKVSRDKEEQIKIDKYFKNHSVYQFYACPFCVKVRRYLRKNSINIELRDAKDNKYFRAELEKHGGKIQVPCLCIEKDNSKTEWIYESNDIINYFENILKS